MAVSAMSKEFRAVAVPHNLTGRELSDRLRSTSNDSTLIYLSPHTRQLLSQYAPTKSAKAEADLGDEGRPDPMTAEEYLQRMIFQWQSEVVRGISTIPVCISHSRGDEETYASKLNGLSRLKTIGRILVGDIIERKGHALQYYDTFQFRQNERHPEPTIDSLILAMVDFTQMFRNMPNWLESVEYISRAAPSRLPLEFDYVADVAGLVDSEVGKGTVKGIVLYGSRAKLRGGIDARVEDVNGCTDYDHNLIVADGTMETVLRAILGKKFKNPHNQKHTGFNVIEQSDYPKYLRMNHDPFESLNTFQVLYGRADFPVVSHAEVVERGISHAVLRGFAMQALSCWNYVDPNFLPDRPELLDYVNKTPLFAVQSALNHLEGVALRDKAEFRRFLEQFGGVQIINSGDSLNEIVEKVCHNTSLIPIILERSCPQKRFSGVPIKIEASPNPIYLDKAKIIRMENVLTPTIVYSV